jgi:hypothetical protein
MVMAMKHAGDEALDQLEGLLVELRTLDGLREKRRGVFYHRSKAQLHFHEDDAGLFADLRQSEGFVRFPVNTAHERQLVVTRLRRSIDGG